MYCWFRYPQRMERRRLDVDLGMREAAVLGAQNIRRVLLVTGDYLRLVTTEYLVSVVAALRREDRTIGEVAAWLNQAGFVVQWRS
jgi:2-iminoacetate synthase ThiH